MSKFSQNHHPSKYIISILRAKPIYIVHIQKITLKNEIDEISTGYLIYTGQQDTRCDGNESVFFSVDLAITLILPIDSGIALYIIYTDILEFVGN